MTIKEWVKENGTNAIVFDDTTGDYKFQYKKDGLYYEGDIVIEHKDFDLIGDEEIVRIDLESNKGETTLIIATEKEDDEEDYYGEDDGYGPDGFRSYNDFCAWRNR